MDKDLLEGAAFLEQEFAPDFKASDLMGLGNFEAYIKMAIDGAQSRPFDGKRRREWEA